MIDRQANKTDKEEREMGPFLSFSAQDQTVTEVIKILKQMLYHDVFRIFKDALVEGSGNVKYCGQSNVIQNNSP